MDRLMAGVKHKTYDADEEEEKQKALAKSPKGKPEINKKSAQELIHKQKIPPEEMHLIDDFLEKFVFVSDGNTTKETIDLKMALKSLPIRVDRENLHRIA